MKHNSLVFGSTKEATLTSVKSTIRVSVAKTDIGGDLDKLDIYKLRIDTIMSRGQRLKSDFSFFRPNLLHLGHGKLKQIVEEVDRKKSDLFLTSK